jgi:hypothetical protein
MQASSVHTPPSTPLAQLDSSLLSLLQDLDINHLVLSKGSLTGVPPPRKRPQKKVAIVQAVLKTLPNAKITPTEFLMSVLDLSHLEFAYFQAAFYAERNSQKLCKLWDLIWSDEKGSCTMKHWMRPHAVDLVCKVIYSEMESAKPHLRMSSKEVTPEFVSRWDINSFMDPIASEVTPVWSRILKAATEPKATAPLEKPADKSRNRHVVRIHSCKCLVTPLLCYSTNTIC